MTRPTENVTSQRPNWLRIIGWSVAGLLLLAPYIAMQFTDEVAWTVGDFVIAAALLGSIGMSCELAARTTSNMAYRWATGLAVVAAVLLVWINGAVGIIGNESNDANLMYGGVLAVGVIASFVARFRPHGMAVALFATAFAQALVAVIAIVGGMAIASTGPTKIILINGFFVALFVGSAILFRQASRELPAGTASANSADA